LISCTATPLPRLCAVAEPSKELMEDYLKVFVSGGLLAVKSE